MPSRAELIAAVRESIYADAAAALDLGELRRAVASGTRTLDPAASAAVIAAIVDTVHRNGQITHLLYAFIAENPMPARARADDTDPGILARLDSLEDRAREDRDVQRQILAALTSMRSDIAASRKEASSDSHAISERIAKIEGTVAADRERGKAFEECARNLAEKLGKVAEKLIGDRIALGMVLVAGLIGIALAMGSIQAVRELTGIFPSVTIGAPHAP